MVDNTAPTLHLPEDITIEATSHDGEIVEYEATAEDVNPSNPSIVCIPSSSSTFTL